jgi:hypothetical protein
MLTPSSIQRIQSDVGCLQNVIALQLHHTQESTMRTATLPAVRVSPDTRSLIESVLREDETLSTFIEQTLTQQAQRRKEDAAFYAEALRRSALIKSGKMKTITAEESIRRLREQMVKKKAAMQMNAK